MARPALIPAIDIMGGLVVRAVGGDRANYQPIVSPFLSSADPVHCVQALMAKFGFTAFYIADIDAIMGRNPNGEAIREILHGSNAKIWLDAGYESVEDAPGDDARILPIIATETLRHWDAPGDLSKAIVSIDAIHGRFLCRKAGMDMGRALERLRAAGARRFIHMRLDAVGAGGFNRFKLIPPHKGEEWYAGGGVRGPEDMIAMKEEGYAGALVSSALHDGRIA